ncbi:MAG: MipA/OmpV family protein [Paracoccus sp. (in: a-proteobacteria)]
MKLPLLLIIALSSAAPVMAQETVAVDLGLGASYKPAYPGSDEYDTSPWFILRNLTIGGEGDNDKPGLSIKPNVDSIGKREEDMDNNLLGLNEIDRAYELGIKATYRIGAASAYATVRKGFGGHNGIAGEFGARYRFEPTDRLILWAGLEAGYGDDNFNQTYFGISSAEAARTNYTAYTLDGGINTASAILEARYRIAANTAVLGEVKYSRVVGDAADSPIVMDESQPSIRLGIVHRLKFGF